MKKIAKTYSILALFLALFAGSSFASAKADLPSKKAFDPVITDVNGLGMELRVNGKLAPGDAFLATVYSVANGEASLMLSQENGETIWHQNLTLEAGANRIKCNLGPVRSGLYILKIQSEAGLTQKAIIIK